MFKRLITIMAFISTVLAWPAHARDAAVVTDASVDAVDVTGQISYLASPKPFPHIMPAISNFQAVKSHTNFGANSTPLWFSFELESHASQTRRIYIEIPHHIFWHINMYVLRGSELIGRSAAGLNALSSSREILPSKAKFPLQIKPGERLRLLFNTDVFGPVDFTTKIYDSESFTALQMHDEVLLGAFYGVMVTLILLNLFFLHTTRDEAYLYHVLSIVALTVFFSTMNGVGTALLWPPYAEHNGSLMMIFASLYFPFQIQFLASFLGNLNRQSDKFATAVAKAISVVPFLTTALHFSFGVLARPTMVHALSTAAFIMIMIGLYHAGISLARGFKPARILLYSYVPFAVTTTLRILAEFDLAQSYFLQNQPHQIAAACSIAMISMALANRITYLRLQHRQVELERTAIAKKNHELMEQEQIILRDYETVLKTTQMLAHDVRKPFSLLRMGLDLLGHSKNNADFHSLMSKLVPEVDSALESVNGMIADVMEIGTKTDQLNCAPECPESLILAAVTQTFKIYPRANVSIEYQISHSSMVYVHSHKIGRALANIYINAVQAMDLRGHTWFRTRDILVQNRAYVEFCIANSGTYIPEESIAKIFDAFFTSGKKNGTGLGLAITRKMVLAHGGQIWCESSKNAEFKAGKVEFYFTLPVAPGNPSHWTGDLPRHSSQLQGSSPMDTTNLESVNFREKRTLAKPEVADQLLSGTLESMIKNTIKSFRVLIIDDERIYCSALHQYILSSSGIAEIASITEVYHSHDAINAAKTSHFDLVITDIDLGPSSLDGFELVKTIRNLAPTSFICIHSNRIVPADHRAARAAGADLFMPKPMGRAQLLRLILEACQLRQVQENGVILSTQAI